MLAHRQRRVPERRCGADDVELAAEAPRLVIEQQKRPGDPGSGIGDRDAAERLTNLTLFVPRERLPQILEADEFYHADLVGLAVVDPAGEKLGTVVAIHNFGAGDLIEVRADGGGDTELVPFDETSVPSIDIAAGKIVVSAPQPLFKPRAGTGGGA